MDDMEVSLKESDLLNLPEYVDDFMMSSRVKDAGFLKFNIVDSCGSSTSLEQFIFKFGDAMGPSLKTLHPITVPHANDIYGHLSIQNQYISRETVEGFAKEMKNPVSYTVTSQNCCMTTLSKSGVDGLLKHYFDHELPSHAKLPPHCRWHQDLRKLKVTAAARKGHLSKTRNDLASLTENEQGEKLQKILESPMMKINEQKSVQNCPCTQCVYTEEIYGLKLSNEYELEYDVEVDPVATANYYNKGFLYANGINVGSKDRNLITPNFSLSYLNLISITSLLDGHFPGLSTPYLHAGGVHSFFPLHVEDLSLFSINFLHHGYPKLWIVVPPHAVSKLTFTILKEINHSGLCMGILSHKYHLVSPTWLETHGIPFNVVIQMSGQGVIVTPNAAHFGFNLGPNLAEAVNFGTVSWIPYGIVHPSCTCLPGQVHADLGVIVQSYCPDMLMDYLQRKIPKVLNDQEFSKCLVHPEFEEANVKLRNAEVDGEVPNRRKTKRHSNRKIIVCPLCETHYAGGHKMRLYKHIKDTHRNLSAEEQNRVESILEEMFPERGNKLQKVTCKKCGNDLAGLSSLKRHQASQGCLGK